MKFIHGIKVGLSIFGVLVLHQALVVLYSLFVSIGIGFQNADAVADGSFTEQMILDQVLLQAANSLIFAGVMVVVVLWLFVYAKRESFKKVYRLDQKPTMLQIYLAITIGFSAVFFSGFIVQGLSLVFPQAYASYVEAFEDLQLGSAISFFLAVVIVAPVFEELLFRGFVFDRIERRFSTNAAIIVSGILFGVYHLNIFQGTFASILGIVLGFGLFWTNSMWIPILIHFVNNAVAWMFSLEAVSERVAAAGIFFEIGTYFLAFVLFPMSIYTLYTERRAFVSNQQPISEPAIPVEESL
jgi:membrane protease YdiL (CAAX protease family)